MVNLFEFFLAGSRIATKLVVTLELLLQVLLRFEFFLAGSRIATGTTPNTYLGVHGYGDLNFS